MKLQWVFLVAIGLVQAEQLLQDEQVVNENAQKVDNYYFTTLNVGGNQVKVLVDTNSGKVHVLDDGLNDQVSGKVNQAMESVGIKEDIKIENIKDDMSDNIEVEKDKVEADPKKEDFMEQHEDTGEGQSAIDKESEDSERDVSEQDTHYVQEHDTQVEEQKEREEPDTQEETMEEEGEVNKEDTKETEDIEDQTKVDIAQEVVEETEVEAEVEADAGADAGADAEEEVAAEAEAIKEDTQLNVKEDTLKGTERDNVPVEQYDDKEVNNNEKRSEEATQEENEFIKDESIQPDMNNTSPTILTQTRNSLLVPTGITMGTLYLLYILLK